MREELLKSIERLAPDRARKAKAILGRKTGVPMPWIPEIDRVFGELLAEGGIAPLQGRRLDAGETRTAAAHILRRLGSRRDLCGEASAIGRDLRLYLTLLGFPQTHLLIIGSLDSPADTILMDVGTCSRRAAGCRSAIADLLQGRFRQTEAILTPEQQLGALVVCLVVWDGALNIPELKMALKEIAAGRIRQASDGLWHVYGALQPHGGHQRRVLMSPLTSGLAVSLPTEARNLAAKFDVSKALKAVARRLPRSCAPTSLRRLLQDADQFFRMQHHIRLLHVDYMSGHLVSDSLTENCYARLLGRAALSPEGAEPQSVHVRARIQSPPAPEGDSALSQIQKALGGKKRKKAKAAARATIEDLRARSKVNNAATALILDWTEWLLSSRVSPSYILMLVGSVTRHLLPRLRTLDTGIPDPDGWLALVEEVSATTTPQNKIWDALANLAGYLEQRTGEAYEVPARSARAPVKAIVISEAELDAAISLLRIRLNERQATIASDLMRLAFHLGCRRWELLGLQPRDVVGELEPYMIVRPNPIRDLKTTSSHRLVSLGPVSDLEFYAHWRQSIAGRMSADDSVFAAPDFDVTSDGRTLLLEINKALQSVTGDPWASFHALRHSAATRAFISLLIDEDDEVRLPNAPFYREARNRCDRIRQHLLQRNLEERFEHEAISASLGHLAYTTTAGSYVHLHCQARHLLLQQMPDYPAEDAVVEMLLGGAGMTRHTRAVRAEASISIARALEIVSEQYSGRVLVFPPLENHTPAPASAPERTSASLADSLRGLSRRLGATADTLKPALPASLVPTPEAAARLEAALPARLALLQNRLKKSGLRTDIGKRNCIWREPTDAPFRVSVHHLCARIESRFDIRDVEAMQQLAADLLGLADHLRKGRPGAYPFATPAMARERLRCMAALLSDGNIGYELVIEQSLKINGKSCKQKSIAVVYQDISQIRHEGPGTLLVRPVPGEGRNTFRHRAWNWVTGLLVLAYGLPEEAG
jgi:integrase